MLWDDETVTRRPAEGTAGPTETTAVTQALPLGAPSPALPPVPPELDAGTAIDQYKILRPIGRGGMGEIYLARDLQLGRKVAIKLVQPELLGSADATARFLREARTTAKFNHPHIVTVYGVGEHEGRPYVALAYLEGQNLRERLREQGEGGSLGVPEALRIGLAIAEALEEAHAHGVLHRDLKPANVMIPRDGRPRVVDFGLAKQLSGDEGAGERASRTSIIPDEPAGGEPTSCAGTPGYMAPEQWTGQECTPAADVWALGTILFELVAGRRPFVAPNIADLVSAVIGPEPAPALGTLADVPLDLSELVASCLAKDPELRPSAGKIAARLRGLLATGRAAPGASAGPFRGLLPFGEKDAGLFFGREAELAAFIERVREHAVLPVVGPSGAGKSSFVQAGLVPRLRERGRWTVLTLRPGSRPFHALAARLIHPEPDSSSRLVTAAEPGAEAAGIEALAARLLASAGQLSLELRALGEQQATGVLLFVDQMEELFTLVDDERVREQFVRAVCAAADDPSEPIRVVFTVRDDFLVRLAVGPEASEALSHVTVIRGLGREALRETLLRPLESVGYDFEDPELVADMTEAVHGSPCGLPLVQFAAQQLWEARDRERKLLLRAAYEQMGGVQGALARHADGVLDELPSAELGLARALLLRLVTPERTRRVAGKREVLDGLGEQAEQVLSRLVGARLVSVRRQRAGLPAGATLELAHESLTSAWHTLARWLDESTEVLVLLEEVRPAAELWHKRGRRKEDLWRGAALADALRACERAPTQVPPAVREFLEASRKEQQRRRRLRRVALLAAFVALAAVAGAAILASLVIADKEQAARAERDRAEARRAEALRESAREAYRAGRILEARAKLRMALEIEDHPSARTLWWELAAEPLVFGVTLGGVAYDVAVAPSGDRVAVACQDGLVHVFDVRTGTSRQLRGHEDQVLAVSYAPHSGLVASSSWNGEIRFWSEAGETSKRLVHGAAGDGATSLSFSPDGASLASASLAGTLRLWDARSGAHLAVVRDPSRRIHGIAHSPDGRLLASAESDNMVRLYDARSGELRRVLAGHGGKVRSVSFHPQGRLLASTGDDGTVRLWDIEAGAAGGVVGSTGSEMRSVRFAPDGRRLATGDDRGNVWLWTLDSGAREQLAGGHSAMVTQVAFGPGGRLLASAGSDKRVCVWDTAIAAPGRRLVGHAREILDLGFSHDGKLVASIGPEPAVVIWDVLSGDERRRLDRQIGGRAIWGPGDRTLWSLPAAVAVHDLEAGTSRVLEGPGSSAKQLDLSPDGTRLALADPSGAITLWDLEPGRASALLRGHSGGLDDVRFGPDGAMLATSGHDGTVRLWDAGAGTLRRTWRDHQGGARSVRFSPDGRLLATAGYDGQVLVRDLAGDALRLVGRHASRAYSVTFHPGGRLLASTSADRTARLWDLGTGVYRELVGHRAEVNVAAFSPDGTLLATGSDDGTVRTWVTASARPYWRAPALLGSPLLLLSHRGWRSLDSGAEASAPRARWREAIEQGARFAWEAEGSGVLCIHGYDGGVELWDRTQDRRLAEWRDPGIEQVLAVPAGCVALAGSEARLLRSPGGATPLALSGKPTALGSRASGFLVADGDRVLAFDAAGRIAATYRSGAGVSAVAESHGVVAAGYRDGNVALLPAASASGGQAVALREAPSSPAVRVIEGPSTTVAVGYANGLVGIWDQSDGALLAQARLHGSVVHLRLAGSRLYAATDLGSSLVWDLGVLYGDYCSLVREIWERVPIVWRGGQPTLAPPTAGHRCAVR
ncbi:MAG: serine/threonine protein kinase [Deltaproteobacteria bacterium]|nr:serine/threonine protein kinase [Deltaproteobacteria bacterium]